VRRIPYVDLAAQFAEERAEAHRPQATGAPSAVPAPHRLGGVLDDSQPVTCGDPLRRILALPANQTLSRDDIEHVSGSIRACLGSADPGATGPG
jgi:hypothetical protein